MGLWPMDFFPENEVRWLADRNSLNFNGSENRLKLSAGGVALSSTPLDPPRKGLTRQGSFSIEIWLCPSAEPTGYRNRIVVFCNDFKGETLFVSQWKSHLLVRWLVSGPGSLKRYREIGMDKALRAGKTRFVSVTSCEKGTTIYLEGNGWSIFLKSA